MIAPLRYILAAMVVFIVLLVSAIMASAADAHWKPGRHNAIHAFQTYFGPHWLEAVNVSYCEAGAYHWQVTGRPQDAKNGQYLGVLQMGSWARDRFGGGPGVWAQAKAAAKNFRSNGYSWRGQWSCQPYTKPMPSWLLRSLGFRRR